MPTIPNFTKCLELGCKQERSKFNAYCMGHGGRDTFDHKKHNNTPKRIESNKPYHTSQWRKLRQIQLSKHPLCAGCLADGKIKQAEHIDHLFPWFKLGKEAFYANIFQSLCQPCHSIKTTLEQRNIYRRYGIPNKDYSLDDYESTISAEAI